MSDRTKRAKAPVNPILRAFKMLADELSVFTVLRDLPSRADRLRVLEAIAQMHGLPSR